MSNIKTVTLDGGESKIETGGQNTVVKNLGAGTIYASAFPDITAGADNVAEIASGAGEVIYDTHGTVYLLGTGRVQLTGTDYTAVNFKQPSASSGGGGTQTIIFMDGEPIGSITEPIFLTEAEDGN